MLIDAGACVHARNGYGKTPLFDAVSFLDKTDVVEILLDAGAVVDAADMDGRTALAKAAREGAAKVLRLLLERGQTLNPQHLTLNAAPYTLHPKP